MMKKTLIALALSIATTSAFSQNIELKNSLQQKFPNTKITSAEFVKEIPGLVELVVDRNKIIYTNKEGSHFVIGHVFDSSNNTDVTQARIDSFTSYNFAELPFNDAIKVVKGNGKREFAVFTDPACPFCKKLEQEINKLDNYTMYVFPTPFKPEGQAIMTRMMCESNPANAWTNYMLNGVEPQSGKMCGKESITRTLALAANIGVSGTPSLLAKSGKMQPGYAPADKIDAWLNANSK
ncbi:DsbC family protein [Thiomicrorhabdus aquaedulcis]|uniref:DsbC family protein n=1 Tax=Thiomicrorhabdus aquaedulcis TaxID=2211106 RepID=UPI000FDB1AF7|nr:DsbC family protein [Thiomicrorhabdus aquaedulcis]